MARNSIPLFSLPHSQSCVPERASCGSPWSHSPSCYNPPRSRIFVRSRRDGGGGGGRGKCLQQLTNPPDWLTLPTFEESISPRSWSWTHKLHWKVCRNFVNVVTKTAGNKVRSVRYWWLLYWCGLPVFSRLSDASKDLHCNSVTFSLVANS